jgi:GT2 family glycosyltransferase
MRSLSIIVPDRNSTLIREILDALCCQVAGMSAQILVVGADEPGLVAEDALVRFIPHPNSIGGASTRNAGMREAQGDIFLFLDHDCVPAPDWLTRHLHLHEQGESVVGGAVTFAADNYLQLADNVSAFHDLLPFTPEGPRPYLSTSNLSVRRTVVERVGRMEARLTRAEDLEWSARMRASGYRLYFEPRAVVHHDPPRRTMSTVWRHWTTDAHDTLDVRLRYARLLQTPRLAKHRWAFLWAWPAIALWATARTFSHPRTLRQYWHTLPLVYLTKLAWCWGAFAHFPVEWEKRSPEW